MTDAVPPGSAGADGVGAHRGGGADADGHPPAHDAAEPGHPPNSGPDQDGTGPIATNGFGAWRAAFAERTDGPAGSGGEPAALASPGQAPLGYTPPAASSPVAAVPAATPPPGYAPPARGAVSNAQAGQLVGGQLTRPPRPRQNDAGPARISPPGAGAALSPLDDDATRWDQPPVAAPPATAGPPAASTSLATASLSPVRLAPPASRSPASSADAPASPAAPAEPMSIGLAALDLLDTLAEVVFRTDAEGRWTYLNPAWTRLTGFDTETSLGNRFIDYVHPEELEHTIALFMAVVVGGADHCHHETRYRTADGYRRVQIRAKVLRDDAGEVVGNIGTIIDVTESRFGAEMATEQGALLELIPTGGRIDDLPAGVVIYDPDDTVRRASRVVDRLAGTRTQVGDALNTLTGHVRPSVPNGPALDGPWGLVATARRTQTAQIGDFDVLTGAAPAVVAEDGPALEADQGRAALGPRRSLRATVIPIEENGETQVAVMLSDVTDLRRAERQQAALAYLGQRALTTLDVPALLREAVELVATTLGVERCDLIECVEMASARGPARRLTSDTAGGVVVARPGPDGGDAEEGKGSGGVYAHVRTCYGRHGGAWAAGAVSAAPGSFIWQVLSSCQPLVIDDLPGRSDLKLEGWLQGDGAVATVGAPIGVGSRAFGVLTAHSHTHRRFTRDEAHFVQSVANVVAAAVELAQMQEDRARLAVFEDRDRIACELHDLVIQRLFSVGLRLQSLVRQVPEPGAVRMSTAISDLDQTIDEVRRTIFDLRPPHA
ncbi:PAS domain S-box protein [Pseudofrankia sp. DC12]|uniref:PAS domain S-box protein n=1 Tax=Pseudofrankia sp. DC12 TaxID=683315 RepID=UPI001E612889|nr:PAS domain S-box protein [Pseudofrankia sp. DC12]